MRISIVVVALLAASLISCGGDSSNGGNTQPAGATETAVGGASPTSPPGRKPNIILIVTDDQRADEWQYMPNVQKYLAKEGASLPNFIISDPLCCPSRTSILTGQYAHNHGVTDNVRGFQKARDARLEQSTLATWLHDGGYTTALFGKYLNGYPETESYVPPGWDEWDSTSDESSYTDFGENHNGSVTHQSSILETVLVREHSVSWISALPRGNPFFAYIAPYAVHVPLKSEATYESQFLDEQVPRDPAFNEQDTSDKPAYIGNNELLDQADIERLDHTRGKRLRTLQSVDALVGELTAKLSDSGQLDNTFIFILSDNGFLLGEHREPGGKKVPYEESVRVGGFVRGPGIKAGAVLGQEVSNIDIAATIAEIAGIPSEDFIDGRSFLPLLRGESVHWRQALGIESFTTDDAPPWSGFRTNELKYVEYETGERELYDLVADPYETENLAAKRDTSGYSAYLAKLKVCARDECRRLEDEGPP